MATEEELKKIFQLCESVREEELDTFDNKDRWIAETKEDGERIMAVVINHDTILFNRRGKGCNFHFLEVVEDLNQLDNCMIDGEIISIDGNFNKLQRRALTKDMNKLKQLQTQIPVKFKVFDVLRVGDNDLTHKTLKERKEELKKLFDKKHYKHNTTGEIADTKLSEDYEETKLKHTELLEWGDIKTIFEKAKASDSEGIVIKDLEGTYEHRRSRVWIKCKFFLEKDIVFTKYEVNPNGIRVENDEGIAVQVAGREQSEEAKQLLDRNGKIEISVQYLEETEDKKLRFPSCKKLIG